MSVHLITGHNAILPNLGARSVNDPSVPLFLTNASSPDRQLSGVFELVETCWTDYPQRGKYPSIGDAVQATYSLLTPTADFTV